MKKLEVYLIRLVYQTNKGTIVLYRRTMASSPICLADFHKRLQDSLPKIIYVGLKAKCDRNKY